MIRQLFWAFINWLIPPPKPLPLPPPAPAPVPPAPPAPTPPPAPKYDWSTKAAARHSVRVICDELGLTLEQKDTLCATVGGESGWQSYYLAGAKKGQPVKLENKVNGQVWSTDWGISQINDHYHIGPGKSFASVEFVLNNPEAVIRWMCKQWKAGNRNWWIAYKSGLYKQYLSWPVAGGIEPPLSRAERGVPMREQGDL